MGGSEAGWRIRPARPGDAPAVATLAGQLGYPADRGTMRGRIADLDADERLLVLVDSAGDVRGWAHVVRSTSLLRAPRALLAGLVVDASLRGRGAGRSLLVEAERWAREQGLPVLRLRTRTTREDAHAFYEACGYRLEKTQRVYARTLDGPP